MVCRDLANYTPSIVDTIAIRLWRPVPAGETGRIANTSRTAPLENRRSARANCQPQKFAPRPLPLGQCEVLAPGITA